MVFDEGAAYSKSTFMAIEGSAIAAIQSHQGSSDKIAWWAVHASRRPSRCFSRQGALKQLIVIEGIGGCEVTAAEVHVTVAMDCVGAAFGDRINNQAARRAILSVVVVGQHLKFLDFIHGGAQAVGPGDQLIGDVGASHVMQ